MRQEPSPEQLVDQWTLEEGDRPLVGNKIGATRLGFALKLKFFQLQGRFPSYRGWFSRADAERIVGVVLAGLRATAARV